MEISAEEIVRERELIDALRRLRVAKTIRAHADCLKVFKTEAEKLFQQLQGK